ncbi:TauD/TfdA family dioxygenase [Streptomyces boninensis]|uniref:TauD/TfdA family dioxygenase n=1 Tax=Streptomyces boninensis TaxID=2039455 RepID=UPI003B20C909
MALPHTLSVSAPQTFALTGAEHDELAGVAAGLTAVPPGRIDDPRWLEAAREASAMLPRRLLAALRTFRHDPGGDGVLLVRDLPVPPDSALPPTPSVPGSVERVPTTAAALVTMAMLQLGEVIAFRNEKTGALVQNVVPVPGQEAQQSNAGSVQLEMHVENAFHENRPDYVGLLCVRGDPGGLARLSTSSIRRALPLVSDRARAILAAPRFITEPPPSFGTLDGVTPAHAVLNGAQDDPNVLVDFAATHPLDDEAGQAMAELRDAFAAVLSAHEMRAGDLAVVDNRMAVHGRTPFTPRYDGTDRWLQRVYAHLDHRRSRVDRPGGGAVLG